MTRYPGIWVKRRTSNSLVLIAEVREALRRAGVDPAEIGRFSTEAFAHPERSRQVCSRWVSTGDRDKPTA